LALVFVVLGILGGTAAVVGAVREISEGSPRGTYLLIGYGLLG
jgi:hypothetical protein